MTLKHVALVAGLTLGMFSGTAQAALLHFDYQGSVDLSFNLDSMPTPEYPNRKELDFEGLDATINGVSRIIDLTFYSDDDGGGFYALGRNPLLQVTTFGEQIYSGDIRHPEFHPTTLPFELFDSRGPIVGTLTISTVPLPASAPLFGAALLALGGLGYAAKRKKAAAAV